MQREAEDLAARVACHPAVQQVSAAALQLGVSCSAYNLSLAAFHVGFHNTHAAGWLRAPIRLACPSLSATHHNPHTNPQTPCNR